MQRAEQSTLWITASEDGASATCVGVAPACKELRSGPNKSEREPTSARSTNYGSGHLIPAFHGTGRTFSLLPSHPLDAASRSIDAPLVSCLRGKVPRLKMVSSNQKRFQLCFVRNSPRGGRGVFHPKRETPPESAALGGLGNPHFVVYEGLLLRGLRFANSRARPKLPTRNVVLWDFCDTWRIFLPDHIAGRFSCSNVTIRTRRGACAWESRRFY